VNDRPRVRPDLVTVEQVYRGEQSFIVKDPSTHKYFRFRPLEALVLNALDGRPTAEVAASLARDGAPILPAAIEAFARKLAGMGLIERSLAERTTLELERLRAERRRRRQPRFFRGDLLRIRWSVGDPDRFFNRTLPYLRWCFSPGFITASLALFALYFVVLAATWPEFTRTVAALYSLGSLTLGTVVILWCTIVVVIGLHELGHGYTCKYFGGEVHEMGFMLLYFEPCFYCNVNDAWSFPELRARLWVTAAGSWIQFVIAGLAALVWWTAVPGTLVSELAVAAMLIGGVTTIATNLNPLIPLDGYFALSDYLGIPNLRQRAFGHLAWAVKRHAFRLDLPEPKATDRERRVFLLYGALAAVYIASLFLLVASLALGWASRLLGAVGGALILLLVLRVAWRPAVEWARTIGLSVRAHRAAWRVSGLPRWIGGGAALLLLIGLAVPHWITVGGEFTAAPQLTLVLIAPDSGVVTQVLAREGIWVPAGAPLVRLRDLDLERERAVRRRELDSLATQEIRASARDGGAEAERLAAARAAAAARLAALDARLDALVIRTRAAGIVVTQRPELLLGRRVESGDTLVTVADPDSLELRIMLTDGGASLVHAGQAASAISYADPARPRLATVRSVAPALGTDQRGRGVEARARLAAGGAWRSGVMGEASVRLRRSNLIGAVWWGIRKRIRSDLLL
jgi:putative peptide zinc metalloprotease protein